ncbi:MAG: hypothetical protein V2J26_04485 [Pacificimonas sp.]|jgi:hypothetical protein|nr:hypothetical protein [Pacificimonas sp.]
MRAALTGMAAALCLAIPAGAQAPPVGAPTMLAPVENPRDLNGVWHVTNSARYNIEAHPAQAAMQMREGPVIPVPAAEVEALGAVGSVPAGESVVTTNGGVIPYTAEAREERDRRRANWITEDPEIKCYLPGVPRATYQGLPLQIVHSDSSMLIVYAYANAVRNIEMEDPGEAPLDSWMGQSYGQWDGDTLVVEVTAQNGQTWFDRAGNHMSYAGTVTERYTKISPFHLHYSATIEDSETFTEPWTMEMVLYKDVDPDAKLHEFNCVEFVEELMYGHLRKEPLDPVDDE